MFKLVVFAALIATAFGVQKSYRLDRGIKDVEFPKPYRPRSDERIVGGISVYIEDYPFVVSLLGCGSHMCGGSILNENTVVTAAHCTFGINPRFLGVRAGSSISDFGYIVHNVEEVFEHQYFDILFNDYDVAVLKLETPLTFGDNIQPIGLWTEEPEVGAMSQTLGYGADSGNNLRVANVPIISRDVCNDAWLNAEVTLRMICTADPDGYGPCEGDAGGPLVTDGKLSGIISWGGYNCLDPQYPKMYANVANLHSFIVEHL